MLFSPVIIPNHYFPDIYPYCLIGHCPSTVSTLLTQFLFQTLWKHFYTTSLLTYSSNTFPKDLFTKNHFFISKEGESSPIETLSKFFTLEDWPESHNTLFIPIDKSNFDCLDCDIGSVALVPKSNFSEGTIAVAA